MKFRDCAIAIVRVVRCLTKPFILDRFCCAVRLETIIMIGGHHLRPFSLQHQEDELRRARVIIGDEDLIRNVFSNTLSALNVGPLQLGSWLASGISFVSAPIVGARVHEFSTGTASSLQPVSNLKPVNTLQQPTPGIGHSSKFNAQVADAASDKASYTKLNEIGELFIKTKMTPPLNREVQHHHSIVNDVDDVKALVDSVMAAIRVVIVASTAGPTQALLVNHNDVKVCIAEVLTRLLRNSDLRDTYSAVKTFPLICLDGGVAWVKYVIDSEVSAVAACCSKTRTVDLNVTMYSYYFPTFEDLRQSHQLAIKRK